MAHDLLPIENDVYRYEASEGQSKEVIFITDVYKTLFKTFSSCQAIFVNGRND